MNDKNRLIKQLLDLIETLKDACEFLYQSVKLKDDAIFTQLFRDMNDALIKVMQLGSVVQNKSKILNLMAESKSCINSLKKICLYKQFQRETCLQKIEFELLPLIQEMYLQYYYFAYLQSNSDRLEEYYQEKIYSLCANSYIDESIARGKFKYDLSIVVLGYNKIEYTKQCVESLLNNLPADLRYELILVNHGSTDETSKYFYSKVPDKQLDILVNGGGLGAMYRIVEGEFTVQISNDVIIGAHAIENLYKCISSDPMIAWVVAATPNISNLQAISADYNNMEEFNQFTKRNNQSDSFRWEQRVRLCNPIDIRRSSVFYSSSGLCLNGRFHSFTNNSFPDDRISLLLRRNGYKLMLAKDAYCHHFGSITLKSEIQKKGEQEYYLKGRQEFFRAFNVDPWGTGFCYALPFMNRVVLDHSNSVNVLGINCGLGANSLKIKEQLKEYCHNVNVILQNVTDRVQFIDDLKGISDETDLVSNPKQLLRCLKKKQYEYIIWEDPFLQEYSITDLVTYIKSVLKPSGTLFFKHNNQFASLKKELLVGKVLGHGWYSYTNDGD